MTGGFVLHLLCSHIRISSFKWGNGFGLRLRSLAPENSTTRFSAQQAWAMDRASIGINGRALKKDRNSFKILIGPGLKRAAH